MTRTQGTDQPVNGALCSRPMRIRSPFSLTGPLRVPPGLLPPLCGLPHPCPLRRPAIWHSIRKGSKCQQRPNRTLASGDTSGPLDPDRCHASSQHDRSPYVKNRRKGIPSPNTLTGSDEATMSGDGHTERRPLIGPRRCTGPSPPEGNARNERSHALRVSPSRLRHGKQRENLPGSSQTAPVPRRRGHLPRVVRRRGAPTAASFTNKTRVREVFSAHSSPVGAPIVSSWLSTCGDIPAA